MAMFRCCSLQLGVFARLGAALLFAALPKITPTGSGNSDWLLQIGGFSAPQPRLQSSVKIFVPQRGALGGLIDFAISDQDRDAGLVCRIDLPDCKAAKYQGMILDTLQQQSLSPTIAGKLVGQREHASAVCLGRSGRAFAWPLRELISSAEHRGRPAPPWPVLRAALAVFLTFLQGCGPIKLHVSHSLVRRAALLFVDAALSNKGLSDWCFYFHLGISKNSTRLLTAKQQKLKLYSRPPRLSVLASLFWKAVRQQGLHMDRQSSQPSQRGGCCQPGFL